MESAAAQGGDADERMLLKEESSSSQEEFVWPAQAVAAIDISKAVSVCRHCFEANSAGVGASDNRKWMNKKAVR